MKPLLQLDQVGVRYRLRRKMAGASHYWAVQNVSLQLYAGDKLAILGANGSGKSTLMKVLGGIIAVDRGTVWRDVTIKTALLTLGVGFESTLTGRENSILSGMLLGLHRQTIEKRLPRIQEFSGLGPFFDQPIYTYSSGMLSRLGFSVALEVDPEILLIDELLSVGDLEFQRKSGEALKQRFRSGKTMVLVTHNLELVQELCSRAIWIHRGVTQAAGPAAEVVQRYTREVMG